MNEGWGWEEPMSVSHFFKNSVSLCDKWGDGTTLLCGGISLYKDYNPDAPIKCKICEKKVKRN